MRKTLQGIANHDCDEGRIGLGRHATCIRLGRELWQSQELTTEEKQAVKERFFDDGSFPAPKDDLDAARCI